MIRDEIKKLIKKAVEKNFDIKLKEIEIEKPKEGELGDYATNVALIMAKKIGKDPKEIAKIIIQSLNKSITQSLFNRIETAGPGFINFFLSQEYLQSELKQVLKKKEKFGKLKIGQGKKIQVEFISANPTGPLTVGNARGGPLGDVLANLLKKAGFKTEKAYYINDYGMQILALGHSVLKDEEAPRLPTGQAKYRGRYIDDLQRRIQEKEPYRAGQEAAEIIIEEMIKKTIQRMAIKYDEWISENSFYQKGKVDEVLKFLKKKNLLYEKEGAIWFKSTKFGDKRDRVLVKSDGWKTYLAGDIALHRYKFEKKKFAKVINIWGADHYGDVAGLQAAVEAIGHKDKLDIILCQFITLLEKGDQKKMSKRKGLYVTMDELLDKVGPDVTRFFFLQKSATTHLNFDLDLAKEQSEKNPVYYVQYAYARICSILRKLKAQSSKFKTRTQNLRLLNHPSELNLIKELIRFPEIIEETAKDYQVQRLPKYALDTATVFHQFYTECKVLSQNKELSQARLGLILATKTVLKNVLDLMGISAPEKM